jgi:uncharacterized protein
MSFGLLSIAKSRELCSFQTVPEIAAGAARSLGLAVGVVGGVTASLTGVGIDMMLYTVLVLLFRMELKVAVPTSVIIMAVTSLMGAGLHLLIGDISAEVFYNWLAAAPVVILGAPLGVLLVAIIPRIRTLYFVSVLCILQFGWTLQQVAPSAEQWLFVGGNLVAATAGFAILYRIGKRRAGVTQP